MFDDSEKENDFGQQAHRPIIMGFTKKLGFTFIWFLFLMANIMIFLC